MKTAISLLIIFSLILTLILFLPYSLHLTNSVVNVLDPLFYAWNLNYNAQTFFRGFPAMINTNIYHPESNTLALSDTLWAQTIGALPIIWLTHNSILAENLSIFFTFPFSAISMFLLVYWLLNNTTSAFLAGLFYAFSYPRIAQIGHLPILSSQYLPLFILFLLRYGKNGKTIDFLWMLGVLICATSSSIYFAVMLLPIVFVIFIWQFLIWPHNLRIPLLCQRTKSVIFWIIPAGILFFLVLYPYILLKIENPDIKRNLFDTMHLRAFPIDYINVLPTSILAKIGFPTSTSEHVLYPTITVLSLALIGTLYGRKKWKNTIGVFLLLLIVSLVLSFGAEQNIQFGKTFIGSIRLPYYYLYQKFAVFQIIRVPARFSIMVIISLCVLAAFGIEALKKYRFFKILSIFLLFSFIMEVFQVYTDYVPIPGQSDIPQVYQWLKSQPKYIIIAELPLRRFFFGLPMEKQLLKPYHTLKEEDNYALETYRVYFSIYHGKRMINGYSGFYPLSYTTISELAESFPSKPFFDMLIERDVQYIIVHAWQFSKPWTEIQTRIAGFPELHLIEQFENDYVYKLDSNKPL